MEELGRSSMSSSDFIDEKTVVQPHDLLQVDIEGLSEETSFRPQVPVPAHAYPPTYLDSSNFSNRLLYGSSYNSSTNVDRFPFFGHHFEYLHYPSPTNLSTTAPSTPPPPPVSVKMEKSDDKKEKRSMQQRIRRINESEEEKEVRRQKNREINRRRRASLKQTGISTEQSRNRLRQRIKREISRMLRTGEKREDFLKETFADVRIFFSDEEYNSLYQRVLETIDYIRCKKV